MHPAWIMKSSVFVEIEFLMLVVSSVLLPLLIYGYLLLTRSISRWTVLLLGVVLIGLSGVDFVLLQFIAEKAKGTLSLVDDKLFLTEMSVALYLLPVVFAGIGVNMASHVLLEHLKEAEERFDRRLTRRQRETTHRVPSRQA